MAKIEAYKFINPGMAADNASEGSLVGRKLVLSFNHFGKTLNSIGSVVKDIENIEISRIKNDELRDKMERRQAQRDRDQDAEDATERKNLEKSDNKKPNKSKIKGFFGRSKIGKGLMSMLPAWAKALQPIFTLLLEIFKIAVIKEMLEWWSDPENKKKIDTFFYKANVIFTKLKEFYNWLVNEKLVGGWHKFTRGDTFKERIGGLGDLMMGVGVAVAILNPIATFGAALTGLGWLVKNITDWLKDPFAFLRNKGRGGGKMPKKPSGKTKGTKQQLKSKYQKYLQKKGIKPKTSNVNIKGTKVKVKGQTPLIPKPGQGIVKNKGFLKNTWNATKGWLGKNKRALAKVPGVSFVMKRANPLITGGLAVLELNERISEGQSPEKAITSTAVGTAGAWTGFTVASGAAATKLSPLLLAPFPGARPLYAAGVLAAGIGGAWGGGQASKVTDAAFDAHEDKNEKSKWWNPLSWSNNNKPNVAKVEQKTPVVQVPKKETKKKSNFWGNLFGGNKSKQSKSAFVQPQKTQTAKISKTKTSSKKWWEIWKNSGGKLPEYGLGGFFKGIGKAVSGVVNGVSKAVGGVINTVSNIASNPIIGTALSFVPGVGPVIGAINAFNSLRQGDIMGAVMGGVGALGSFANINTVNAISQPRWMQNLRFSKFGEGLAGMYHSGANAWAGLTSGVNNFMGSKWGSLAKGVYQGATGGGWGGALSAGSNILGLNEPGGLFGQGGFFGEGGRMANMGNWLHEHNLAGIGNMFPGLSGLANSIPGFANLPGIQDIFAGGFSPMQAIGGLAEKNGMGGLYKSAMGLLGGGDMFTGLKELAGEIGVSPEALGAVDKGKSLYDRAKGLALQKDPVELLPIVMPIIQDQIVISPAVKEKAVIFHDIYNDFASRL